MEIMEIWKSMDTHYLRSPYALMLLMLPQSQTHIHIFQIKPGLLYFWEAAISQADA
jgi:hypothetical protein